MKDHEPKAHIITFGCQMNEADSEKMAGLLAAEGYSPTDLAEEADVIVVNTCSIRAKAEQKAFSLVGRLRPLKKKRPGLLIAVAGCMAQKWGEEIFKRASGLDVVVGTGRTKRLPELLRAVKETGLAAVDVDEEWAGDHPAEPLRKDRFRAWINIIYGCNNYCAYCVVPYVRGRERSRPPGDILKEATRLAGGSFKEATLLGQNVNSYGRGLPDAFSFRRLLEELDRQSGLSRLRFTTSHPKDFNDDLIRAIAELPTVCESVHLPLQAGSDRVLAGMNRGYRYDDYLRVFTALKEKIPGVTITTDIIVGFPGETRADYRKTKETLEGLQFDSIFSFRFSPREGTAAWNIPDDVPEEEKIERLIEVQSIQRSITTRKNRALVGTTQEILVEGPSRRDDRIMTGRTRGNRIVHFKGDNKETGEIINVRIKDSGFVSLSGEMETS